MTIELEFPERQPEGANIRALYEDESTHDFVKYIILKIFTDCPDPMDVLNGLEAISKAVEADTQAIIDRYSLEDIRAILEKSQGQAHLSDFREFLRYPNE
tara:strand:+ start:237 stop:536 length:300 start_codon:yes stop_codon:yes gene_type:complete